MQTLLEQVRNLPIRDPQTGDVDYDTGYTDGGNNMVDDVVAVIENYFDNAIAQQGAGQAFVQSIADRPAAIDVSSAVELPE